MAFMIHHMLAFNALQLIRSLSPNQTLISRTRKNIENSFPYKKNYCVNQCVSVSQGDQVSIRRRRSPPYIQNREMRGWKDLEVVETIYEDEEDNHHEDEDEDSSSSSSPTSSSSPNSLSLTPSNLLTTTLESIVQAWSLATGLKTDVMIYVQDQCFHLHKDPLTSRIGYLRRHLKESSKLDLSPPLNITAETFTTIVDFCYSSHIVITPFNVAPLRIASELLDMTDENGVENLQLLTESYFRKAVSVNGDYTSVILRSCLAFLPEAEETASLASRCIQALTENFDGVDGWIDDVKSLEVDHFQIIADSMQERFTRNHDLLYRIVEAYFKEHSSKLTEEQKTRICSTVDCSKLSPHLVMHAVQNPIMPLRFIVRAMFVEHINTRHSIISTLAAKNHHHNNNKINKKETKVITLGRILQRDAAIRQVALLKASVEATASKIQSLERDLMGMKQILSESKNRRDNALDSTRSASFHFSTESRIESGERGSTSSVSFRFSDRGEVIGGSSSSTTTTTSEGFSNEKKRIHKSLGWRLINGLKTTFRKSSSVSSTKPDTESRISTNMDGDRDVNEDEEVVIEIKEDRPPHRRSRSLM